MMMRRRMLQMILLLTESVLVSSYQSNSTVQCKRQDERRTVRAIAGESLYLPCPNTECHNETENTSYEWFKCLERTEQVEQIGTEESERIHYHLSELYILWLTLNDTGRYITRWWYEEDEYDEYETDIVVYEEFSKDLLYTTLVEEKASRIHCPVCEYQQATFIWYKDFSLIPNQESAKVLRIRNSSKESEGIYTCVCTWEHNGIKHNTSASRRLEVNRALITHSASKEDRTLEDQFCLQRQQIKDLNKQAKKGKEEGPEGGQISDSRRSIRRPKRRSDCLDNNKKCI